MFCLFLIIIREREKAGFRGKEGKLSPKVMSFRQQDRGGGRMKSFSKAISRESHVRRLSHLGMKGSKSSAWGKPTEIRKDEENVSSKSPLCSLRTSISRVVLVLKVGKGENTRRELSLWEPQFCPRSNTSYVLHQWEPRENPFSRKSGGGRTAISQRWPAWFALTGAFFVAPSQADLWALDLEFPAGCNDLSCSPQPLPILTHDIS